MFKLEYDPIQDIKIYHIYEFYDEPIIFSFYNSVGSLFLANYIDWNEESNTWLYLPVSLPEIKLIETGKLNLREAIINARSSFTYIVEEYFDGQTQYYTVPIKSINEEYLPSQDSFIEFSQGNSNLGEIEFITGKVTSSNRYVVDISLEPEGSHVNEIEASSLGNTLINFQELVEAISLKDDATNTSRIPNDIREKSKMKVTDTYAASFGIRLESDVMASMMSENDLLNKSLMKIMELLSNSNNLEISKELLTNINKKGVSKYKIFINNLIENSLDGKVKAAFPRIGDNIEVMSAEFSSKSLTRLSDSIDKFVEETSNEVTMKGTLVSYNSETTHFKFVSVDETNKGSFIGKTAQSLPKQAFEIPSIGTINLLENISSKVLTGEETKTYHLLSWEPK